MRTWRLLVDAGGELWTFLVAAGDHLEAWELALRDLGPDRRRRASLEELENAGARRGGAPRVVAAWRGGEPGGGRGRAASGSGVGSATGSC